MIKIIRCDGAGDVEVVELVALDHPPSSTPISPRKRSCPLAVVETAAFIAKAKVDWRLMAHRSRSRGGAPLLYVARAASQTATGTRHPSPVTAQYVTHPSGGSATRF